MHCAFHNLFVHNPLLRRYRYSQLRLSQLWIYVTIYVALVILLLFVNHSIRQMKDEQVNWEKYYNALYFQFAALQTLILIGWATLNSRAALRQEGLDKTYDFFRLLPISALQKAVGILVGRNLVAIILGIVTFVFIVIFGRLGKVTISLQLQLALLLICGWLFSNSTSLLSSGPAARRPGRAGIAAWAVFFIILGPMLLHLLFLPFYALPRVHKVDYFTVKFYTLDVRILVLSGLIQLYFGAWNILGILRRFTYENEPLFTRIGAVIFLLGYEAVALGLFWPHLARLQAAVYAFWLATIVPICLVPLASVKTFDHYLEHCGLVRGRGGPVRNMTASLLVGSNLTLALIFFLIWAGFAALAAHLGLFVSWQFLFDMAVILSFCLFLMLLLEVYVLYSPLLGKIALLLGFAGLLYLFLPIVLWAVLDKPTLYYYSLFGFFAHLLHPLSVKTIEEHYPVLVVNGLLCIAPLVLIIRRYLHILALRKEMQAPAL